MATWHVAAALEALRHQLNAHAPRRSTVSDGGIGDAAHASRSSDHNPWYRQTVTARDFTHDPAGGLDGHRLADSLVRSRDPRIKYIIWHRRICSATGAHAWTWRPYSGSNPHTSHLHLSVVADPRCEDRTPWRLDLFGAAPTPDPGGKRLLRHGARGEDVRELQRVLAAWYPGEHLAVDGVFGPHTERVVRRVQQGKHLAVDGIVGPQTYAALGMK